MVIVQEAQQSGLPIRSVSADMPGFVIGAHIPGGLVQMWQPARNRSALLVAGQA